MKKCKKMPTALMVKVINEVTMLLHASRDGMRNKKLDTTKISFHIANDGGYSAEAFGVMRGLVLMGYGYFGSVNMNGLEERNGGVQQESNFKWWFAQLEQAVLQEEGFYSKTHRCEHCINKYRKDDTRVKNFTTGEIFDKNPNKALDAQIIYGEK
jgi:hypothetical protein